MRRSRDTWGFRAHEKEVAARKKAEKRLVRWGVFPWTPNTSPDAGQPIPDPSRGFVTREAREDTGRGSYWPYSQIPALKIYKLQSAADKYGNELTFGKGNLAGSEAPSDTFVSWRSARQSAPYGDSRRGSVAHILSDLNNYYESDSPGMHVKIAELSKSGKYDRYALIVNGRKLHETVGSPQPYLISGGTAEGFLQALADGRLKPSDFPEFKG